RRPLGRQHAFPRADARQRLARHELHGEEYQAVARLAEVVYGSDVRVLDATRVGGFAIESPDGIGVGHELRAHHLHRASACHLDVFREIHATHRTLAQLLDHAIAPSQNLPHETGEVWRRECGPIARTERD